MSENVHTDFWRATANTWLDLLRAERQRSKRLSTKLKEGEQEIDLLTTRLSELEDEQAEQFNVRPLRLVGGEVRRITDDLDPAA